MLHKNATRYVNQKQCKAILKIYLLFSFKAFYLICVCNIHVVGRDNSPIMLTGTSPTPFRNTHTNYRGNLNVARGL